VARGRPGGGQRLSDGILLPVDGGFLRLQVKGDSIVRVLFSKVRDPRVDEMVVVTQRSATPKWTLQTTAASATLATAKLRATVNVVNGSVAFADSAGRPILTEIPGSHRMTPADVQGERTYNVQQMWEANGDESLYGLGQRQEGKLDIKGYDFDLWQRNTVVAMPFLVSSRGYGILWDNTSFTKFGDVRPFEPIPLAVTPPGAEGELVAPVTGDYQIQTYSNLDIKVWLDGQLRIDHWKQNWATEYDQFKVHLDAGRRYAIKITSSPGATLRVMWKTPPPAAVTSLWSEVGEAVDYYFVYGPELDQVVAGYRTLTGQASLLPRWAYGFWQSKNKYNTQAEVLDTLREFRSRKIPIDNIVQDWQYWKPDEWGTHQFDAARYPDPAAMIKAIHDRQAHFMISVWGKFYPNTANAKVLQAIGGLYEPPLRAGTRDWLGRNYTFYDVFNAPARRMFWEQVNAALFSKGVDAWWMDATEPDIVQPSPPTLEALRRDIGKTAAGTASRVLNAYSLLNSKAVYDGQRGVAPDRRVFILTRSGFAGIQRYATVTWSGDITSEWSTLRKQIPAGLGFSISGSPYWTTDTGGYTMQQRFTNAREGAALDEWRELNARWFQYSTFSPILRVHGTDRPREMWNLGDESTPVYQAELKFDRLRYALFPYIYSVAGMVTHEGYTTMRPLVMDFRGDAAARDIPDQYMFGPAFLVNPVTEYKARSRPVYLPAGTWYDFWTGKQTPGGRSITADAPYDRLPVFVRAGSIIPMGPEHQYIGETDGGEMTLYVYAGRDGEFSIYEDDGLSYGYERGQLSKIPVAWTDNSRTLLIGNRSGSFAGMPGERTFNIVLVTPGTAAGYSPLVSGRKVAYRGRSVRVDF
jgi:alpha-D-xyloside xylohydrolase